MPAELAPSARRCRNRLMLDHARRLAISPPGEARAVLAGTAPRPRSGAPPRGTRRTWRRPGPGGRPARSPARPEPVATRSHPTQRFQPQGILDELVKRGRPVVSGERYLVLTIPWPDRPGLALLTPSRSACRCSASRVVQVVDGPARLRHHQLHHPRADDVAAERPHRLHGAPRPVALLRGGAVRLGGLWARLYGQPLLESYLRCSPQLPAGAVLRPLMALMRRTSSSPP